VITLLTGQPGNGKTLHLIWMVEKILKETPRPVYYWNIKGLQRAWLPMGDASTFGASKDGVQPDTSVVLKWWELPHGSLIVIDEAQGIFRPRGKGHVPDYVAQLETHRHNGHDLILLTQHPQLIDNSVRKLAGRHINVVRRFGMESATIYQWETVKDPTSDRDKKEALKTTWSFPKELYGAYQSAEVHTVRKDFPWKKVVVLVGGGGFVIFAMAFVLYRLKNPSGADDLRAKYGGTVDIAAKDVPAAARNPSLPNFWDGAARTPRVKGMPDSAPMYDHMQAVRSMPSVAGCLAIWKDDAGTLLASCSCVTDQSTPIEMDVRMCLDHVQHKVYDPRRAPQLVERGRREREEVRSSEIRPADNATQLVEPAT
jgi:zona occludens toxin